jgi:predicted aconitase
MDYYLELGCRPTWTCAPYQLPSRPTFGDQVAWAESNAVVFANSVLGARTNRYGDFIDICAALTGRVPDSGLHRTNNRRGQVLFQLKQIPTRLLAEDVFYPVLGHLVGAQVGSSVPVIDGLGGGTEDQLKALGAAAASSGSVALFHVVGVTPEAATLEDALQGGKPTAVVDVTPAMLRQARDALTTSERGPLVAVSLGTPHFSLAEFAALEEQVRGLSIHPEVDFYVSTSRSVLSELERLGWLSLLEATGMQLVVDTCTYITPILRPREGLVMTNSAKWAYYAPGNLGVHVAFGSLAECLQSATRGRLWRDQTLWYGV